MTRSDLIGAFEELVLLALYHCQDNAYGMAVRRELERRLHRNVTIGAVYTTLERLEAKGYVSSRFAGGDKARAGRPRRYFKLVRAGQRALQQSRDNLSKMWDGVEFGIAVKPS